MMSLATLLVLPYLAFVFFGEGVNPFRKPRQPNLRARWRYGQHMGLAAFVGWICSVALINTLGTPTMVAVVTGIVMALILSLCFSVRRIGEALRH